jgi:hypothetical protein
VSEPLLVTVIAPAEFVEITADAALLLKANDRSDAPVDALNPDWLL